MDEEIKNLIDEYIKHIEGKELELVSFKKNINEILLHSKEELKIITNNLDVKLNNNNISEEEYLVLFRKGKENILVKTKERLDDLLKSLST